MGRKIEVTDVILRDAHQSLIATRLSLDEMLPACADLDEAGYWSLECWGGATFDACIRFLNEDPWERLREFKKVLKKTPTQMLLRGQNLLGYRHYGDDVVDRFVDKAAENGMDVFRVFDAVNDPRNLQRAMAAVKKAGKHAQGTICYTISPVHNIEGFVELAEQLLEMGADSICIKDMAALLKPQPAYDLVKAIKTRLGEETLVHVHVHSTTGVTLVSLMKAIEAGADIVDTAVSSLSLGPGHNPTESLVEMLEGTPYTTGIDLGRVQNVKRHFAQTLKRYGSFRSEVTGVETEIFKSQIPGGMLSNLESQLKQQGQGDRLSEVLDEVPRVREAAGFVPLVTPTSQIVGTQAVLNVLMGPYQVMTGEFADLVLGYYGKTKVASNPEVVQKAEQQTQKHPITLRPADLIAPEWAQIEESARQCPHHNGSDEDSLTYALFPQIGPKFFETRPNGPINVGSDSPVSASNGAAAKNPLTGAVEFEVKIKGESTRVKVEPL